MKITIDTKEDSPEEIKNAIKMLSFLIGEKSNQQPNIFENSSPEVSPQENIFGDIFEDKSPKSDSEIETTEETKIKDKEIKEDLSIIEYY